MKLTKLYCALLVFAPVIVMAQQQQTVDRNVTVEREYQPMIEDAGKITTLPGILEPVTTQIGRASCRERV